MKLLLYINTVRYLKFSQIIHRLIKKIKRKFVKNNNLKFQLAESNVRKFCFLSKKLRWTPPNTFSFMERSLALNQVGWNGTSEEKLWHYNQHYFDGLDNECTNASSSWKIALLEDWVHKNPMGFGVGWDPYPTSLRIVNWIKFFLGSNDIPNDVISKSLFLQLRWLFRVLEYDILGNHLFANAKALLIGGLYFQSKESDTWLKLGLKIIDEQLNEQVLDDGAHFELSPMYHGFFLEDLLDLINFSRIFPGRISLAMVNRWLDLIPKLLNWMEIMSHPDGNICSFNDSSIGTSLKCSDLVKYSQRLGVEIPKKKSAEFSVEQLKSSGFIKVIWRECSVIMDVGEVGPAYLPAHAHADTLSFEMSVNNKRIFVNGGTSTYEPGENRLLERGTRSHNTVVINDKDSSEVWGSFRTARRASVCMLEVSENIPHEVSVTATHDGYCRFLRKIFHKRSLRFHDTNVEIVDTVKGDVKSAYVSYHLHPSVFVDQIRDDRIRLRVKDCPSIFFESPGFKILVENFYYSFSFGNRKVSNCLRINFLGQNSICSIIRLG